MRPSRQLASRLLILAGALLLLASSAFVWAERTLFDSDGFSDHVSDALGRRDVQTGLARIVVDRIVEARPELREQRPVLETAAASVVASDAFREGTSESTRFLHAQILREPEARLVLLLGGVVGRLKEVLEPLDPAVAATLPELDTLQVEIAGARDVRVRLIELAERLSILAYLLPALTLAAFAGAIYLAPDRISAIRNTGIAVFGVALLVQLLLVLLRYLINESLQNAVDISAVNAATHAFTRWMSRLSELLLLLGFAMAAIPWLTSIYVHSEEKAPSRIDTR